MTIRLLCALLALGLSACTREPTAGPASAADAIYYGGDILTMEGDAPQYAEAVAVKGGRIALVGSKAQADRLQGDATELIDLQGHTLLPGFIDSHSHISNVGFFASIANLLPAPDGAVNDIPALVKQLQDWGTGELAAESGWIIGMGYDESQLAEGRHPNRHDLDAVSKDLPVLAIHITGHLAAVNSKALALLQFTKDTPNPAGGIIHREADGTPSGLLEETAFHLVAGRLPAFDPLEQIARGQQAYAAFGFTTAQEGRAFPATMTALAAAADAGQLYLDINSYPDFIFNPSAVMQSKYRTPDYTHHYRIAGIKMSLDGSPSAKTAWLTQPYFKPPHGAKTDYRGYGQIEKKLFDQKLDEAFANGYQVLVHANGDAAIDFLIAGVREATRKHGAADRRPVAIHAQTARADQLDAMRELGIIPSFFTMHTFYFGDFHRDSSLGPERAANISPEAWALQRGMRFTSHHDAPVVFPNSIRVIASQVTRLTRSGQVLGPEQRVSPYIALKALTLWGAYQYFQEDDRGSLKEGKIADFVILDRNPLKTPPEQLMATQVLTTIKEGRTVYRKQP
jgi:predicted amidohydrolase YtcJ